MEVQQFGITFQLDSGKAVSSLKKLDKGMKTTVKTSDKLQKEAKETGDAFEKSNARIAESTGKVDKRFKKVAKSAKAANDDIQGLGGGTSKLSKGMSTLAKVGIGAAIAGFAALVLAAKGAIKVFGGFEQSMADLSAITGATGKDLEFYNDAAREMGAITTLSASEVADAFRLVASAKPDLLESKEALKAVTASAITLAEAAGITVPEAANTMASALNQFGEEADQAVRFTNVLAAGSKFGAASIAEMGEAMKFAGVAASNFGLSFEETNAALQLLSTNAIKGGEAGTQLKGVLLNIETKMSSQFRPSVVGFAQAMENLRDANLSATEATKIFGTRNFIAGQIFANNTDKIKKLTEAVTGTNIAQEQAAIRTDTFQAANKRLESAFQELALVLTGDSGVGKALSGFIDLVGVATLAVAAFIDGVDNLGKDSLSKFESDVKSLGIAFKKLPAEQLEKNLTELEKIVKKNNKTMAELRIELAKGGKTTGIVSKELLRLQKQNTSTNASILALKNAVEELAEEENTLSEVIVSGTEAKEKYGEATQGVIDKLEENIDALKRTDEQQELHLALTEAQTTADTIAGQAIANKVEQLQAERKAIEDKTQAAKNEADAQKDAAKAAKKASEDATKAAEDAAEATQEAWQKNRDSLSDFFTLLIHDGNNAWDTLLDGFKNMLTKMVAEAAANQILIAVGMGGAGAGGIASSLAGGSGGGFSLSSLASGASSLYSGASSLLGAGSGGSAFGMSSGLATTAGWGGLNAVSGGYQAVGNIAYDMGMTSIGDAAMDTAGSYIDGSMASGYGAMAANIGAGILGNLAGGVVFDQSKYSNVGSTIGGTIGSIWGPIGTAIGSFIGNGIGSLFGRTTPDKTEQSFQFDDGIGSTTRTDNRGHDMDDAASQMGNLFATIGEVIGATGKYNFSVHGEDGFRYKPDDLRPRMEFGTDSEAFFDAIFKDMVHSSDTLSDTMKTLFYTFDGTIAQTTKYATSLMVIDDIMSSNAVDDAATNFKTAMEAANKTVWDSFQQQTKQVGWVIENFDNTAGAAARLADKLLANKEAAYQMAVGIQNLSHQLKGMFENSAASIRESVMTKDELFKSWRTERDTLRRSLGGLVDPDKIASTAAEIERLNTQMFNSFGDPSKQQAENFANYAESVEEIAQRQLDATLESVRKSQEDINAKINTMLEDAATKNLQASATNLDAAGQFQATVNSLQANGITVNISMDGREVNV